MHITKISQFTCCVLEMPLLFVRVDTDEGIFGIGEATLAGRFPEVSIRVRELAREIEGTDVFAIEKWFSRLVSRKLPLGGSVLTAAASGIETALWDLIGKKLSLPVHKLIGGKIQQKLNLSNPSKSYQIYQDEEAENKLLGGIGVCATGWCDGCRTADEFYEAAKKVIAKGFWAIGFKPITSVTDVKLEMKRIYLEEVVQIIHAVRSAVGDSVEICIDLEEKLDYDQTLWLSRRILDYKIGFMLDPMHSSNTTGYSKLIRLGHVPLAIGAGMNCKHDYMKLFQEKICSVVQIDPIICGGIFEMRKIAAAAEAYYMKFQIANSGGPLSVLAGAHVGTTLNFCNRINIDVGNFSRIQEIFGERLIAEDGFLFLRDDLPGIGVVPDFSKLTPVNIGEMR